VLAYAYLLLDFSPSVMKNSNAQTRVFRLKMCLMRPHVVHDRPTCIDASFSFTRLLLSIDNQAFKGKSTKRQVPRPTTAMY